MNAERCEFLAGNSLIEVIPSISDSTIFLISGDIGPFEAGVPCKLPIWIAILMKRKHNCKLVAPKWMEVDELKKILTSETENQGLASLPDHFFEITHMLVRDATDDIFEVEAVKSLVQDIYDRRDAKLRTSAMAFLSQVRFCWTPEDDECHKIQMYPDVVHLPGKPNISTRCRWRLYNAWLLQHINSTCHAQLDCVQLLETSSARATLEACKQMGIVIRNKHESTPL
ncbi:Protein CBG19768 [Caenorhabditis briggsae]|uniref:DNA replication complex GINS protein PSF2 n=1 Tax=Caenorhabditis briggsae TaxID=6238 RepID=A8XWD0_CAEBR|nr:Protein CBG19768 [Caenorhabditis briggsae]CAP36949.2 Protein CBG19768 [Caenorhabditis briggsae]